MECGSICRLDGVNSWILFSFKVENGSRISLWHAGVGTRLLKDAYCELYNIARDRNAMVVDYFWPVTEFHLKNAKEGPILVHESCKGKAKRKTKKEFYFDKWNKYKKN